MPNWSAIRTVWQAFRAVWRAVWQAGPLAGCLSGWPIGPLSGCWNGAFWSTSIERATSISPSPLVVRAPIFGHQCPLSVPTSVRLTVCVGTLKCYAPQLLAARLLTTTNPHTSANTREIDSDQLPILVAQAHSSHLNLPLSRQQKHTHCVKRREFYFSRPHSV